MDWRPLEFVRTTAWTDSIGCYMFVRGSRRVCSMVQSAVLSWLAKEPTGCGPHDFYLPPILNQALPTPTRTTSQNSDVFRHVVLKGLLSPR